jgi:hypothetical protein
VNNVTFSKSYVTFIKSRSCTFASPIQEKA